MPPYNPSHDGSVDPAIVLCISSYIRDLIGGNRKSKSVECRLCTISCCYELYRVLAHDEMPSLVAHGYSELAAVSSSNQLQPKVSYLTSISNEDNTGLREN